MLDKTGTFEVAEWSQTSLPPSDKPCVRCGSKERIKFNDGAERCRCWCLVPQCYESMKGCYIASVKDIKAKHDPLSPADIAERQAGVQFIKGDIDTYIKNTTKSLAKAAQILREMEEGIDCKCKNCKKKCP